MLNLVMSIVIHNFGCIKKHLHRSIHDWSFSVWIHIQVFLDVAMQGRVNEQVLFSKMLCKTRIKFITRLQFFQNFDKLFSLPENLESSHLRATTEECILRSEKPLPRNPPIRTWRHSSLSTTLIGHKTWTTRAHCAMILDAWELRRVQHALCQKNRTGKYKNLMYFTCTPLLFLTQFVANHGPCLSK